MIPVRRVGALLTVSVVLLAGLVACRDAVPPVPARSTPNTPVPSSITPRESRASIWRPPAQVTWQWQLTGDLDLGVNAEVFDVDLFTTTAEQVRQLHSQGRKVICYLDAGSFEPNRPDSAQYPTVLLGKELDGWSGERWLDIRRLDLLIPLIAARMDLCVTKGFDGVEPDNVDGYANDTGFDLTAADQGTFNRTLAQLGHERGLAVGLKNDLDQVAELEPLFDFAVNEQCIQYDECSQLLPFVTAGKPVLHVEYDLAPSSFCPSARAMGLSSMRKSLDLDSSRTPC